MGEWRYYAQRAASGLWLDTNAQLADVQLTWTRSGPSKGSAMVPSGLELNNGDSATVADYIAEDGRAIWGKWDTILLAEEDGELVWGGICSAANPSDKGLQLEFVGSTGWLQRVDYSLDNAWWQVNVFDVVRHLIRHAMSKPDSLVFEFGSHDSQFTVGDAAPPSKPKEPARKKGQTVSQWKASTAYKDYQKDLASWTDKYGDREQFVLAWYESPYVGEEIDTLAKETGFDYRETVRWLDKGNLTYRFGIDFQDSLASRRDDIAFVDGQNLANALDPKDGNEHFANHVIGLGAGEGRKMARVTTGTSDGRLYQAEFVQYKSVTNTTRLRALTQADFKILNNKDPKIQNVVVWDVSGYADLSTLKVGDEVRVVSNNTVPPVDAWVQIVQISKDPRKNVVVLSVETVG